MLKRTAYLIFILLTSFNLYAQYAMEFDGKIYHFQKNEDVQGSPFLFDDWKNGKVFLKNGAYYDNIPLKFDAEQNKFLYNRNNTFYEFVDDLLEIRLYNAANDTGNAMIFKNNVSAGGKFKPGSFVQVLCQGKITLVKEYVKKIVGENRVDGYRQSVKQYVLQTNLWAIVNDQPMPAKMTPNFLEELTSDKRPEVDNYIKANGLKIKTEKGFVAAIAYYDLISKK